MAGQVGLSTFGTKVVNTALPNWAGGLTGQCHASGMGFQHPVGGVLDRASNGQVAVSALGSGRACPTTFIASVHWPLYGAFSV